MEMKMKAVLMAVFLHVLSTSLQIENVGRLYPAQIDNGGVTKVNESEKITFTCVANNTKKNTTIMEMYLFKNGKRIKLEATEATGYYNTTFTLTKITPQHSGLYTCLYSEENLRVSTTNTTGHNSVSLEVLGKFGNGNTTFVKEQKTDNSGFPSLIISVSVAVSVVLLALLGFCCYRVILSIKVCQDPEARIIPNSEPFYHEIDTDDPFYTLVDGELKTFNRSPVEKVVDDTDASYTTVQMLEVDEQPKKPPEDKNVELTTDAAYYDSIKAPYAAINKHKDRAADTNRSCKGTDTDAIYSRVKR